MAEPEVKVKIGADTSGLQRGLGAAQASMLSFAKAAGVKTALSIAAVAAGMVALTKRSLEQVDAQAKLAQSLGTTVSSMQTLKRAGELAGVSMGGIQQATGDLTRRLSQAASGAGPVAAALDRLNLSASSLANVPLDQRIMKINEALDAFVPSTERAAVAGQLFGEEGSLAMSRIDTATLRQATEDVYRFGVVVSEQNADQIEIANDAVTRLSVVMEGLGNRMAVIVAPALEATANGLVDLAARALGTKTTLEEFFGSLDQAQSILGRDVFQAMAGNIGLVFDNAIQLEEISVIFNNVAESAMDSEQSLRDYAGALQAIGEIGAADVVSRLADEMGEAVEEFNAGSISAEDFEARLADLSTRAQSVVGDLESINGVGFGAVIGRLSGLAGALAKAAAEARRLRASLPGGDRSFPGKEKDDVGGGPVSPFAPTSSPRPERPTIDSFDDFLAAGESGDQGGGAGKGGAGMTDALAQRLEALQESLATEAEVIAAWYAESATTLQSALEQQLLTEEEYRQSRERLEAEHQERLKGIRQMGADSALSMVIGTGQEVLEAIGQSNEKALRVAKVFGAAQALISAYQGAAEALKLPFPQNIAAAATVMAKGIGFANAIKSVNAGGGGGGSGGGSSSAAGGVTETRTANINFYGGFQPTQESIDMIASGLNDWLGDGGRLNVGGAS